MIHLASTVPWDGALGGGGLALYSNTRRQTRKPNFLNGVSPLNAIVSENLHPLVPHAFASLPHTSRFEPLKIILISRCRDNISLLLLNIGDVDGKQVRAEGCLSNKGDFLSLPHQGAILALDLVILSGTSGWLFLPLC